MEKQIFDWTGWDDLDTGVLQFYHCTLKVPVGDYPVGAQIENIVVSFADGVIQLYSNSGELLCEKKLKLVVCV